MNKRKFSFFNLAVGSMFVLLCILTLYPFVYAFLYSISDGLLAQQKDIILMPAGFTLQNYETIFRDNRMLRAVFISVTRTIAGTGLFLIVTGLCGYSMSKKKFKARKILFIFFVIPMYISGGMMPHYVLIHDLGLMNNFLVYILPSCFIPFYMFLIKVYLETIPESLEESAFIEGAGDLQVALRIYLPLSMPVIATMALFVGVSQWNSWFDALLYVTDIKLHPLQMILQTILRETQINSIIDVMEKSDPNKIRISPETYKMAVLMVTTFPITIIYPFAQKYFVKGMTIGAVKL